MYLDFPDKWVAFEEEHAQEMPPFVREYIARCVDDARIFHVIPGAVEWDDWRGKMGRAWRILNELDDRPKLAFHRLLAMMLPRKQKVRPRIADRDDWTDKSIKFNDLLDDNSVWLLRNALADTSLYTIDVWTWREDQYGEEHPLTQEALENAKAAAQYSAIIDPHKRTPTARKDYPVYEGLEW